MNSEKEVERYEFEKPNPIKGYPELYWRGKRPFTSTQYYPAQLKERYGEEDENGWINKIFWGDNLQVMSHLLKEYRGKVKLIYIDPPFDSKAEYKKTIKLKDEQVKSNISSFEEKQYADIWVNDEYLQFMYERLILMRELLSDDGSIYLHCDSNKVHHLRCLMDEVFGISNFKNEIIWWYLWGGRGKTQWNCKHDNILFYTKSDKYTFNYMDVLDDHNLISESSKDRVKYKGALVNHRETKITEIPEGKVLPSDTWYIPTINAMAKEKTNYPTQKPEKLVEKIIKASSNEGDLVLDCFMGSGTTPYMAMSMKRKCIGIDINLCSVSTTINRLIGIKENTISSFELYNVNNYDIFRNQVEAKEILIKALGIQSLAKSNIYDGELDGRMVKIMSVNRIATRADLGELISELPYKEFEKRENEHPNAPVEKIMLVCMGHEPDLKGYLQSQVDYKLDIEIVDILRDKTELQFKRDSEANIIIDDDLLVIHKFYPRNLLQKMSILDEDIEDWRQLVDSVIIDFNYDGAVMEPSIVDIPEKNELVKGKYKIPEGTGVIKVKITDVLSETFEWEGVYEYGKEIGIESLRSV